MFVFFVRLVGVDGPSMMPTLQDGDYVALLSNLFMGDLEQGDVIVARKESFENGEPIVKRVIATEGQTVDILYDGNGYGTVYVDGEPLGTITLIPASTGATPGPGCPTLWTP